jgi:hypothetical protein
VSLGEQSKEMSTGGMALSDVRDWQCVLLPYFIELGLDTGRQTESMFDRYADLFSDAEKQARQLEVQERRRMWRDRQMITSMPQSGAQTN